jgi:uncharacterized protein
MKRAIDVVRAFYDAAESGRVEELPRLLDPGVRWTEMEGSVYGGTYHGPDAVLSGVFARLGSEWQGYAFHLERLHDAGDSVAASGHYTGTYLKTGKPMRCRTLHVWDVRDGKIVGFEQFCDTLLMSRALG